MLKAVNLLFQEVVLGQIVLASVGGSGNSGRAQETRQVAPHVNFMHCIFHTDACTLRDILSQLHFVLREVIKFSSLLSELSCACNTMQGNGGETANRICCACS